MPSTLSGKPLIEQKKIFEDNLVKEVLAWIRHSDDIMGKRAERLPECTEKLINYTTKAVAGLLGIAGAASAIPSSGAGAGLSLGALAVDAGGSAINAGIQHHQAKKNQKFSRFYRQRRR